MRGRRNLARERAAHAATEAAAQQRLYAMLCRAVPQDERALIGRLAVLRYLNTLGIQRRDGRPLSWRMILRWRRDEGFPLCRGFRSRFVRSPSFTTNLAVTAWLVTRYATEDPMLWRVGYQSAFRVVGKAPQDFDAAAEASRADEPSIPGSRPLHSPLHREPSAA